MQKNIQINKVFLDTNIIVDIIDHARDNHFYGVKLIEILIKKEIDIAISEDMLTTIYYIVKDKLKVIGFINYIMKKWNVYYYGDKLIRKAIKISMEKNVDFKDVLQCLCAVENKCDLFITNDKKFYNCGIKLMSSKEFTEKFF